MIFTYRSVQIFKIIFRRFLFFRIWSSAQDYALMDLVLNPVVIWISTWQNVSVWNDLYQSCEGTSDNKVPHLMGTIWSKIPYDKVARWDSYGTIG